MEGRMAEPRSGRCARAHAGHAISPGASAGPSGGFRGEAAGLRDEARDPLDALARAHVREHERPPTPHLLRIALHQLEACAYMWREVDLVDDEEIGAGDAGAALSRDLLAHRDVDD